jgi:hypothetical protein
MSGLSEQLHYYEKENKVFMPNEIFNDLKSLHGRGSSHVAFAYSYYYLVNWLFRYCKYDKVNADTQFIKEVLGYHKDYKKLNYMIKKNGLLDEMGYTLTSTDYPITWDLKDGLEFTYLSELDPDSQKILRDVRGRNFKIKYPVKGLWRSGESSEEGYEDGTFFEIDNTHMIPFEVFIYCMENGLGVTGFYLYSYLSYRCQWFEEFNSSVERLGEEIGYSKSTTERVISKLFSHKLIDYKVNECKKINGDFVRKANTYMMKS